MTALYGNRPDRWDDRLTGIDRLRTITNVLTRLRFCTPDGIMEFEHKGEIAERPAGFVPWFAVPGRQSADSVIVCGHWSALGLKLEGNLLALDTGCLWGGCLSAVSLKTRRLVQVSCAEMAGKASWK